MVAMIFVCRINVQSRRLRLRRFDKYHNCSSTRRTERGTTKKKVPQAGYLSWQDELVKLKESVIGQMWWLVRLLEITVPDDKHINISTHEAS